MAVSVVQGKTAETTGTSTTITLTSAVTAGNLLAASIRAGNGAGQAGLSITDASNTWNVIDTPSDNLGAVSGDTMQSDYAANVAGGSYAVTVHATANGGSFLRGSLEEASGVATASPLRDHGATTTPANNTSLTATTGGTSTVAGDLVWSVSECSNGSTYTFSDTAGQAVPAAPSTKLATQWRAASSGGSQTGTFTITSSDAWCAAIATFKAAAGGPQAFTKALAGTLSTGGSILRAVKHSLAGAMSFAGSILRSPGKPLAGALSFSGALGPKSLTRGLQAALTSTGGTLRAITHPFSGTLSSTGSAPRSPGHLLAGSLSFTGSSSKIPGRALGAALNFTGGIAKRAVTRILTPALTFTGGISRSITHPFSGSLTSSGSILRSPARLLSGALSFAGSTNKIPGRALAASLTFTGAIAQRAVTRAIAAALTFTGAIGRVFSGGSQAFTKALSGALTFTGSIQRGATHNLISGLTSTGLILRTPARIILATLSFAGTMGKKSVTRIITASLPPNGSLLRVAVHSLTATLAFTGSALGKLISLRFLTGSISFAGSTARSTGRFLTPVLSFTGNTKRAMTRILLAILSPAGQTLRAAIHSLSGALSFAGVSTGAKVTLRALTGALGLTGATRRGVGRFATATLSFVGTAAQLWHGTGKRAVRVASVVVAAVKTISQVRPRQ